MKMTDLIVVDSKLESAVCVDITSTQRVRSSGISEESGI